MGIEISTRLKEHLLKDDKWYTCVTAAKKKVETLISGSPMFFPDYTGHGISHINEVLKAADRLITDAALAQGDKDESSGILEPSDVGYLICAILIHDLGMFLKEDGVRKLISGGGRPIPESGDPYWKNAWSDYIDTTHRSTWETMRRHFGKYIPTSADLIDMNNMGDDEKRIIGEFLRRNHGRLAHEIALRGLPGSTTIDIFEGSDLTESDRDMIGLLARSHSISIRETEGYLKAKFEEGPMPENIPVFFLMSVLRIADLLDAGAHRAAPLLLAQQRINVPVSNDEWTWNQRIDASKSKWMLKNKKRTIYAEPKNSIEYVMLDRWLRWVQSELDLCWSILAECYPDGYRLSIHRVTSRIHEPSIQKTMRRSFLPREVTISANPEITRLLIEPLYGNDPSYGVRELLQNAVDACEERRHREGDSYKGLVTIRVDPWEDPETGRNMGQLTIEDNGVGMNEYILLNYYLSAGASYRSSDEWKKTYASGGRSKVARTGRFGVGFLASFLLGDTVEVLTQHVDDDLGYTFSFTNEITPLNVERKERPEGAGTTIRIKLKDGVWGKLTENMYLDKSDDSQVNRADWCFSFPWCTWYAFDTPKVHYFFDGDPIYLRKPTLSRFPSLNTDWFTLKTYQFDTYLWKPQFRFLHISQSNLFFCNGIRIDDAGNPKNLYDYGLGVLFPDISLIDRENQLDINLARSKVQSLPEKQVLIEQVFRYHIARLLMTNVNENAINNPSAKQGFMLNDFQFIPLLLTDSSFQLNNAAVLAILRPEQLLFLYCSNNHFNTIQSAIRQLLPNHFPHILCTNESINKFVDKTFFNGIDLDNYADAFSPGDFSGNIWIREEYTSDIDHYLVGYKSPLPGVRQYCMYWPAVNVDQLPPIDWENYDPELFPVAIQVFNPNKGGDTLFAKVLREVLEPAPEYDRNDIWIPFDMDERRKKFPKAFRELEVFIKHIEKYGTE